MTDIETLKAELQRAREELVRLRAENLRLRAQPDPLRGHIPVQLHLPDPSSQDPVTSNSSAAKKVGLFGRLFPALGTVKV